MQRVGPVWVVLVSSVLLMALLQGCPGDGAGDSSGDGAGDVSRFAGAWQGTTSQGHNVSFVVANDNTITTVSTGAHITGNGCTAADLAYTALRLPGGGVTSESIVENRFSVVVNPPLLAIFPPFVGIERIVMMGTFVTESTASGELQFTANLAPSPCPGTATATFQARKQ